MAIVQHISMRVAWRDQPWNDKVCSNPLDNSSCLLLKNIGGKRDDAWEAEVAGRSFADLADFPRLPCLSERGTFMSAHGYLLEKEHPYRFNKALKGHLEPSNVSMPAYSFEAVPFRWLSRETATEELWLESDEFRPELEDAADRHLGFKSNWLMDGQNQRAMITRFFEDVVKDQSLVLIYLKHSPLQEQSTRRLLVGAARVTDVVLPSMWKQSGRQPFDSSMWETAVSHSLRPQQHDGILMPYQALVPLMDAGRDVSDALAWAPEDADIEFSYVTEHVSTDTAIAALLSLRSAADGMMALGVEVPTTALSWLEEQIERLWNLRGPAPGMSAVLGHLGLEHPHKLVRRLIGEPDWSTDPWGVVERAMDPSDDLAQELGSHMPASIGHAWRGRHEEERKAYKILSAMEVTIDQISGLLDGGSTWEVSANDLVDNPYFAATCTHRSSRPIALATVDQACFPAGHVAWAKLIEEAIGLDDPGDTRRVEALLVEVLDRFAEDGDTLAAEDEVLTAASDITLTRPCPISRGLLTTYRLDPPHLGELETWTPLVAAELEGGLPAYQLLHLHEAGLTISDHMRQRRDARRFEVPFKPRIEIDDAFGPLGAPDPEEDLARTEKAAGLAELFASRLSVLVGPAGTGKTSLLRTLVSRPEIAQDGVLLLAPTGKARVQLQTKVRHEAQTLASFLVKKGGFDHDSGRYLEVEATRRTRVGLVVVDEASMLTEEMLAATLSAVEGVKRLVLVGDHRQLPPIGAGRPFVDLVDWLKPPSFTEDVRVAPGYVELTVSRRQREAGGERDDVALARWFGGEDLPSAADEIWQKLRRGDPSDSLAYRQWNDDGIVSTLLSAIEEELGLTGEADPEQAFKLTYGGRWNADKERVDWDTGEHGAGAGSERWQVLSPTRTRAFGTVELNRALKQRYRAGDLKWAQKIWGWRPPKPMGPEQIVLGDKVMQIRNDSRRKSHPEGAGLDYIANGEIGIVTGSFSKHPKWANVEFSSQVGATYGYRPSASEDPDIELAWAVTVHKSQGSEFGVTFLVLPAGVHVSRELLYTALTRQTTKVVILHEGTVERLFSLASPALSETARRMTNLFQNPAPRQLRVGDGMRRFDGNRIHVAPGGVLVRSKNEVIVASILDEVAPDRWSYEQPLTIDGVTKYPDFTIETPAGDEVVWEHLGMMGNPRYAADWEAKRAWYLANGYRPFDDLDAPESRGILMWSDDRGGVDQPAWAEMAQQVLGAAPRRRTAGKKAAGRRL